jgi:hypothetical protein
MNTTPKTDKSGNPLQQLEETLDLYLGKKAPPLPENIKETIVKISPWVTLVVLIISLPAILAVFGIGALLTPLSFMGGLNGGFSYMLSMLVSVVTLVLEGIAIPGLMKRTKQGWNLVYYSVLIGLVANIISMNVGGILIGTLVPLYFLFQVKSYYK